MFPSISFVVVWCLIRITKTEHWDGVSQEIKTLKIIRLEILYFWFSKCTVDVLLYVFNTEWIKQNSDVYPTVGCDLCAQKISKLQNNLHLFTIRRNLNSKLDIWVNWSFISPKPEMYPLLKYPLDVSREVCTWLKMSLGLWKS